MWKTEPARRYEHETPGSLIHVDVKKLGNIPDGGGWRFVGREQGSKNRRTTPGLARSSTTTNSCDMRSCTPSSTTTPASPMPRSTTTKPRPPRSECCAEPSPGSPPTASPSNGSSPTTAPPTSPTPGAMPATNSASGRRRPAPTDLRPTENRTFPPHLADGWAFSKHYASESARRNALPAWLHFLQSAPTPHRNRQGRAHHEINVPEHYS